jgi:thymidylate synthase (FAD)
VKVITEPKVYVVGRSNVDDKVLDDFLQDHDVAHWETDSECGGEVLSETAGRVCYMSFAKPRPGGNKAYLGHIKESGHGSVLEHPVWNLIVSGVSRSLSHELVRHRAGFAYSQLSQRYVDESVCEVIVPKDLQEEVAAAQKLMELVTSKYHPDKKDLALVNVSFAFCH